MQRRITGFRLIEIRKLAAVDMAWLGKWVILSEYALGVVLPLALGLVTLRAALAHPDAVNWQSFLAVWLVTIAANYVPLLFYALAIARAGTVREESVPELKHAKRYGIQQAIILVPLLVVAVALAQERRRRNQKGA